VADTVYTYAMDEFGNITALTWAAGGGGQMPNSKAMAVSPLTNQLSGAGYYYDVLGNLVTMPAADSVGTVSMSYLDQGHIGTLTDAAGGIWKYYYDADGKRRIKVKTAGGAATEPDGQGGVRLVADRSFYFYEGEDLICQQDIGALVQDESQYEPKFLLLDHLGSTRAEMVFDPSTLAPQIQEYYDLMPYGEVIDPPSTQESVLFTGKPKDAESGLDLFGDRYYLNGSFRWISPDEPFVDNHAELPQKWNLYNYVSNNPVNSVDVMGRLELRIQSKVSTTVISGGEFRTKTENRYNVRCNTRMNNAMDTLQKIPGIGGLFGTAAKGADKAGNWAMGDKTKASFDEAMAGAKAQDLLKDDFGKGADFEKQIEKTFNALQPSGQTSGTYSEQDLGKLQTAINVTIDGMVGQVLAKHGLNQDSGGLIAKQIRDIGKALKKEYNIKTMKQDAEKLYQKSSKEPVIRP